MEGTRMRIGLLMFGLASSTTAGAQQGTPSIEEVWAIVQRQQTQIQELERQLAATQGELEGTTADVEATQSMVIATGDYVESLGEIVEAGDAGRSRTAVGGYGELHFNSIDADDAAFDADEVDFHRFVLFFGHQFNDRIRFFSELELEHSLVTEDGPGEVELEQAYLDFGLTASVSAQAGLFLLPVGILNETHEPPTFYGVERNDVESIILPSTWWEAGAAMSGNVANGLSWNVAAHSGLAMPTTGANAFAVRSGRQKVAEALASDPAYTFRLRYTGVPGLELAASYQYQSDPSQMPGDGLDSGRLLTAHAIFQSGPFSLRALYGGWSFSGVAVEAAGGDDQSGWFVEPSYKLTDSIGVYARYEDLEGARDIDKFTQWEAGLNYWPDPTVVIKLDLRARDHDVGALSGRNFDAVDVGIGYQF
ncbi:MAG TPA: porin [Gammaproteobacteria bacterium]|nr:porin [Gammaproteobacteria bacterium]